jgi:hypothetical protein
MPFLAVLLFGLMLLAIFPSITLGLVRWLA